MTCLVVHAGARATGWSAVQRQLVAARTDLAAVGVQMEPDDVVAAWHRSARAMQTTGDDPEPTLKRLMNETNAAGRDTLLLSSPRFLSALSSSSWTDRLARVAGKLGFDRIVVVVVVREQIGALNQIYCERVLALETAAPFSAFVGQARLRDSVDYSALLGPALATADLEVVTVPWSQLDDDGGAQAVLDAAGIDVSLTVPPDVDSPESQIPGQERLPGPVHVAASRLLVKRLTARGGHADLDPRTLAAAVARVRRRAEQRDWDGDATYWGWTPALAEAAAERYAASNDAFARAVWGSAWTEPVPTMPLRDLQLLDAEPKAIADIVDILGRVSAQVERVPRRGGGARPAVPWAGLTPPGGRRQSPGPRRRPPQVGAE
ncbi:MAG: hypothetical protein M3Q84_04515 [Actinomycetota bacterium]|nr:hypothetical protein [Actinomycetota bacterium]